MRLLRVGTARAAEELGALVRVPVGEVSGPKGEAPDAPLLVGTEAVLHRVRSASLVVFLDFDQELLAPRYRAVEQAMALLVLAGRLVGPRGATSGPARRVVVQTRLPGHEALVAAVNGLPAELAVAELAHRRELGLPPCGALALLSGERVAELADDLGQAGLELSRREDGELLVRAGDAATLADVLRAVVPLEAGLRVEVDPLSV
jgi:primosomal protein N' (replication factor Y)